MARFSQEGTYFSRILFNTILSDFFCHLQHKVKLILRNLMLPISIMHHKNSWWKTEAAKSSLHSLFCLLHLCSLPKLSAQRFRAEPVCPCWFYFSFFKLTFSVLQISGHLYSCVFLLGSQQLQSFRTAFLRPEVRFSVRFYLSFISCAMVTFFFLALLGFSRTSQLYFCFPSDKNHVLLSDFNFLCSKLHMVRPEWWLFTVSFFQIC